MEINITLASGQFHATEHAIAVTPNNGTSTIWLNYLLDHLNLNQYATGQAQPGLSVENIERVTLRFPKNENEQERIANCLLSIDSLIAATSGKITALKGHKKGLMQKLFPAVDEVSS